MSARAFTAASHRGGERFKETIVAVVDTAELQAAQNDPRVRSFLKEADAYLAELGQQGRNR
jgi:hypothetical protein